MKFNYLFLVFTWTMDKFIGKGASDFDGITSFDGDAYLKVGYRFQN